MAHNKLVNRLKKYLIKQIKMEMVKLVKNNLYHYYLKMDDIFFSF